ncbi:MAG: hypothetical protein NTY38_06905 [Acidobacteria bacterium]|nr:hypothetical protein [Acidobacteriota bacterium]
MKMPDTPAISFGEPIPDVELRTRFGSASVTPVMAPDLAFRMVLPHGRIEATDIPHKPVVEDEFTLLAAYKLSDEISIQVLATLLPYEVNLLDWLSWIAQRQNFRLLRSISGETACGPAIHAEAEAADGAFLRLLVAGPAERSVLVVGRLPWREANGLEPTLGLAAASFEFLSKCRRKTREPLLKFTDRDNYFQLLYPASWSFDTEDSLRPEKAGANFRLTGGGGTLAYLRMEADTRLPLDHTGLEQLFQLTVSETEDAGITIEDLDPLPPSENSGPRERWAGTFRSESGRGEIALLFRRSSVCWLAAAVLAPLMEDDPIAHLRARRFYEIAAASLCSPVDAELTEEP